MLVHHHTHGYCRYDKKVEVAMSCVCALVCPYILNTFVIVHENNIHLTMALMKQIYQNQLMIDRFGSIWFGLAWFLMQTNIYSCCSSLLLVLFVLHLIAPYKEKRISISVNIKNKCWFTNVLQNRKLWDHLTNTNWRKNTPRPMFIYAGWMYPKIWGSKHQKCCMEAKRCTNNIYQHWTTTKTRESFNWVDKSEMAAWLVPGDEM